MGKVLAFVMFCALACCHGLNICIECRSKEPIYVVKDDHTSELWKETGIYRLNPSTSVLRLEFEPRQGESWQSISANQIGHNKTDMSINVYGEGANGLHSPVSKTLPIFYIAHITLKLVSSEKHRIPSV